VTSRALAVVVVLAVLVRVGAALWLGDSIAPLPGTYDQVSYDTLAQRVVAGHGFSFGRLYWPLTAADAPTAFWSFLYTGYLAAVYALFGHNVLLARLLQAVVVGVLLPIGLYRLGRAAFGERVGLLAAGLAAVYAYFVYYSATLMTEMPTIVAVVWLLVALYGLDRAPSPARWLGFGLLVAAAGLLRQVVLLPLPALALWLLWRRPSRATVAGLAGAAAVALLVWAPVTLRNYRAFGRVVLLNTNAGFAFYWANHPVHGTDFQSILPSSGPTYQDLVPPELRHLDEAAMNDALMDRGFDLVLDDPVRYLRLSASRAADYFLAWPTAGSSTVSNLARVLSFGLLLPFMLAGLAQALASGRWREAAPLYLFVVVYSAVHLLSWALVRYRLPVDAVLLVFAGVSIDRLVAVRARDRRPAEAGLELAAR
jgi:4-amino-4-deoxy-L-arabinose transferase-like glycosyltransferase